MASTPTYSELERRIEFLERELERRQHESETLREREQKYRRIFENAGEAIFLLENDRYVDCNPKAQELFGCRREDIIGSRPDRFSPPCQCDGVESLARARQKMSQALSTGEPQFFEWRHARLDGTAFDTEVSLTRIELFGKPVLLALVKDITERKRIQDSLRRSEEEYRTLVENLSVGVYRNTGGPEGRFLKINRAMLEIFGFDTPEEFMRTPVAQMYCYPEQRRAFIEQLERDGLLRNQRLRLRRKDGSSLWASCTAAVKRDAQGNLLWIDGIMEDISEIVTSEEELRKTNEVLQALFECSPAAVVSLDCDRRINSWNPAAERIFGWKQEEVIGRTFPAVPEKDLAHHRKLFDSIMNGKTLKDLRMVRRRKDGSEIIVKAAGAPLRNASGEIIGLVSVMDDISEMVASEEALRKTNEILQALFECSPAAVVSLDCDRRINSWNPAAERIFGWKQEEVIGRTFPAVPEKDLAHHRKLFNSIMNGKTLKSLQLVRRRKDGSEITVNAAGAPLRNASGEIIGLVSVMDDITDRIRAREELQAAKAETEAANRELMEVNKQLEEAIARANEMAQEAELGSMAKSQFLANMSHEIRTPLNGVIGFTDMLMDTDLDETQRDYTMTIRRSGEALLSLINDILDFSKIEAGELEFEEIEFDLELLAYDVCELIRPKVENLPVEILCRIANDVPSRVISDPLRFRQVLTNLMGNASKFTDAGEIEMSLDVADEDSDGLKIHVAIRDTGIGIPEEKLEHIFSPFQQVDGSTTRKYGGTGLGLSICRQIANLMDGEVWVESPAGVRSAAGGPGSVFHFTAWVKKAETRRRTCVAPAPLAGRLVLIVDDNQANRQILAHILDAMDMQVVSLSAGDQVLGALEAAEAEGKPFDCLISDIQMPGTDGYAVARQVRASDSAFSAMPLIALSSMMEDDADRCRQAGFDAFLTKPVRREKLCSLLERTLSPRPDEDAPQRKREIITHYSAREDIKRSVRILLAEDNPVNQKLAKLMLSKAGYSVDVAGTGREAVEKYTAAPDDYDLIFMDIQMPDMDGIEATCAIREFQRTVVNGAPRHVPIVAMTAHAMKGDRERCIEAGMDDYTTKPIKRETVLNLLEKWVFREKRAAV